MAQLLLTTRTRGLGLVLWGLLALLAWPPTLHAQNVSDYAFSQSTGTYTPITGGTVLVARPTGTPTIDDQTYSVTIPSFNFRGTSFTTVSVGANGSISFGGAIGGTDYTPISTTTTSTGGRISALGADLGNSTVLTNLGEIRHQTVGDEFVIQYTDITGWFIRGVTRQDFQIRLNVSAGSSNGQISIVYGPSSTTGTGTASVQVGLRGASSADFNNRAGTWAASTAGTTNTATILYGGGTGTLPANGLTFTFTPPPPCTGTPAGGAVTPTTLAACAAGSGAGQVISVTGGASGLSGLAFLWEASIDGGANWTAATGTNNQATYTTSGFSGTVTQFRRRTTCTNSTEFAFTSNTATFGPAAPTIQTTNIVPTALATTSISLSFTAGNGGVAAGGRFVYINTINTFTDPVDGADPVANNVYGGSGQQLIFRGTGTTVTVTGLTPGTTYFFRAYEFTCGTSTRFNVSTATGNPAQINTVSPLSYGIEQTDGIAYSSILSTGSTPVPFAGISTDDQTSDAFPIGFNFQIQGQTVNQLRVCTNGWASYLATTTSTALSNQLGGTSAPFGVLAPFWEDLVVDQNTGGLATLNANIRYQVTGSAPNRVLTVEWANMRIFGYTTSPVFNFQIKIYETTNVIEYLYGRMEAYSLVGAPQNRAFSYSVGIKGLTVSTPAQQGEILAQQYENSAVFHFRGGLAANVGANGLRESVRCNSRLRFDPAGTYTFGTEPTSSFNLAKAALNLGAAPSNDNPTGALVLEAEGSLPASVCGSGLNATFQFSSRFATPTPSGNGITTDGGITGAVPDDDVWYKFTANNPNTTIRAVGSGGYHAVVEIYSFDAILNTYTRITGAAATGPGVQVTISTAGPTALTPGVDYYVRVFHFNGGDQATAAVTAVDANGRITTASLTGGGSGYVTVATPGGTFGPRFDISTNTGRGGYIVPTGLTAGVITAISVPDPGIGYAVGDAVTVDAPGWGYSGEFALVINATPAPPANDECATATELPVPTTETPSAQQSIFTATSSPEPTCNTPGNPIQDVWYVFRATFQGATVRVTPDNAPTFDGLIQVFSLGAHANATAARGACGTKTLLSPPVCQNSSGSGSDETAILTGLVPDEWYAVRVYHAAGGPGGAGTFRIAVFAVDNFPPLVGSIVINPPGGCTAVSHTISASITDGSGIVTSGPDAPTLIYRVDGGSPVEVPMTNTGGSIWQATVPPQGSGAVTLEIRATDLATPTANTATVSAGSYQDAYLIVNAGNDRVVNVGSPTTLVAQDLSVSNTVKITEVIFFGSTTAGGGTGWQLAETPPIPYPSFITEPDDNIEISNVGNQPIDVSGWSVFVEGAYTGNLTFPSGTIIPPSSVAVVVMRSGTNNPANRYFFMQTGFGVTSGANIGVYVRNSAGRIVDAVAFNNYTFPPALGIGAQWSGPGVISAGGFAGARLTTTDVNTRTNWVQSAVGNPTSIGDYNTTLTPVAPATITWSGGNLSGTVNGASVTTPPFAAAGPYTFTVSITDGICTANDQITVTAQPPVTPTAEFIATPLTGTVGGSVTTFDFTDQSTNAPENWTWTFTGPGTPVFIGGTSASSQNPQVQFSSAGVYTVSLTASNSAGSDTRTRTNYITVTTTYCTPIVTSTVDTDIGRVAVGSFSRATGGPTPVNNNPAATGTYSDFSAQAGPTVQKTVATPISVSIISSGTTLFFTRVNVYIDYNQNGIFELNEVAFAANVTTEPGARTASGTITIPFEALTGPTRMRVMGIEGTTFANTIMNPCGTYTFGEIEDYTINITAPPPCTTPPSVGAITITSPNPACGTPALLEASVASPSGSLSWEVSNETTNPGQYITQPVTTATLALNFSTVAVYNIRVRATAPGCPSALSPVATWTVQTLPASPTATLVTPATFTGCASPTNLVFTGTPASGTTLRWFDAATGGNLVGSGSPFNTASTQSLTLFAESFNSTTGCGSTRIAQTATNSSTVGTPNASNLRLCGVGSIDLLATNGTNGTTLRWFNAPTGGTQLGTGSPLNSGPLSSTTTFFVESFNPTTSCVSQTRREVTVTVDLAVPAPPQTTGASRCGNGTVTLTATGPNVRWFDASSGGTLVATGPSFITPVLGAPTTYFAETRTVTVGTVGLLNPGTSTTSFSPEDFMVFNVVQFTRFLTFQVRPVAAGSRRFLIENASGTEIWSRTVTFTAAQVNTLVTVDVNLDLPVANNYFLVAESGVALTYNGGTAAFPFNSGTLNIVGSSFGDYPFFYNWRFTQTACASATRTPALARINPSGTWQGVTSDWNTASNWCGNIIPGSADAVLIPTTPNPPIVTGTVAASRIAFEGQGMMTLNGTLNLGGDLSGTSTGASMINGTGTINIAGPTNVSGRVGVPNLSVGAAGAVSVSSGARLQVQPARVVTIATGGTITIDPTARLVLRSGPAGTASIAPITASQLVGPIAMQRYIPNVGWHFIGTPITNATYGEWAEMGIRITPPNTANIYRYTEPDTTRLFINGSFAEAFGWKIPTNLANAINPSGEMRGFRVYASQNFVTGSQQGIVTTEGQPMIGNYAHTYTRTVGTGGGYFDPSTGLQGGYNLLTNPYPSAIDWDAVVASNGGAGGTHGGSIYIWNPDQLNYGQYIAGTPGGVGSLLVGRIIPSSQSFFINASVLAPNTAGTLNFTEAHKSAQQGTFLRTGSDEPFVRIRAQSGYYYDEAMIWVRSDATMAYDQGMDVPDRRGDRMNFSFVTTTAANPRLELAYLAIPRPAGSTILPCRFQTTQPNGTLTISATVVNALANGDRLVLHDLWTGTRHDMATGDYVTTITSDPASRAQTRFEFGYEPASVTSNRPAPTASVLSIYPNPVERGDVRLELSHVRGERAAIEIVDVTGRHVATHTLPVSGGLVAGTLPTATLPAGAYTVIVRTQGETRRESLIVR